MPPAVAIVMRAKNEMPHAERTLAALQIQTLRNFDLVAVDSGSTDGTMEQLERTAQRVIHIAPEDYVPGKVLNHAIAQTAADIIVLLNADAVPQSEQWFERLIRPILENEADATFSRQIARPNARFIVAYDYERAYDPARMRPGFFSAVACAFKRTLWEARRFREEGYAEDAAWARACMADGARFRLVSESVVEHSHNYTLEELYRKRFRQAAALGQNPAFSSYLKEMVRDLLHAGGKLALHTIPYNIAYRTTIYRARRNGAKEGL